MTRWRFRRKILLNDAFLFCLFLFLPLISNLGIRNAFAQSCPVFLRGDANNDSEIDISDAVFILLYQFAGTVTPACRDAADVNNDNQVDITDPIYLLNYLFKDGPPPRPPFPDPGPDPDVDTTPPEITNVQPADGVFLKEFYPLMKASYSDPSGINSGSIQLKLNNINVTPQALVSDSQISYQQILNDGIYSWTLDVADNKGNVAHLARTFGLDNVAPIIKNIRPATGSQLANPQPVISAEFSDAVSSVDLASVVITVDNQNMTSLAAVTTSGFTLTPPSFTDGNHTVNIQIKDGVGLAASASTSFDTFTGPHTVNRDIVVDTIWPKSGSPYTLTASIVVRGGATLTIEAGVEVRADPALGQRDHLQVDGAIKILGTAEQPVHISGSPNPQSTRWGGITLNNNALSSQNLISHAVIENADKAVFFKSAPGTVEYATLQNNYTGIDVRNSATPRILHNIIRNNNIGISANQSNGLKINNNALYQNGLYEILVVNSVAGQKIDANDNWWGTTDSVQIFAHIGEDDAKVDISYILDGPEGSRAPGRIVHGRIDGQEIWHAADNPILVANSMQVLSTAKLTIEPGVQVLFPPQTGMEVQGALMAVGLPDKRIRLTSGQPNPAPGGWVGISIFSQQNVEISFTDIEYAFQGIYIDRSNINFHDNTIKNCRFGIKLFFGTESQILRSRIVNNERGIFMQPLPGASFAPVINDNDILSNAIYNIETQPSASTAGMIINAERNWWGNTDRSAIAATIFDLEDTPGAPLVDFEPFLTVSNGVQISNVSASLLFFRPDIGQTADISFTTDREANVTVQILNFLTHQPVRALIDNQLLPAGAHTFPWNGKNAAGQALPPGGYQYVIHASNNLNQMGDYDPYYSRNGISVDGATLSPQNFDPRKGETATIHYTLSIPSLTIMQTGLPNQFTPVRTLFSDKPQTAGPHTVVWDGRNDNGGFVAPNKYLVAAWAYNLPENTLVIDVPPENGNIIGTISANPFVIYPVHGEVTTISYTVNSSSIIEASIVTPAGQPVRALVNGLKGAGNYTLTWDGKDDSHKVVSATGDYQIRLRALGTDGSIRDEKSGNITVFP